MFILHIISEELHFNFQSSFTIYQKTILLKDKVIN